MACSHQRNVAPMQAAPRCGARTRSGAPCRAPMIACGKRCRMHGGKGSGAPRGNRNAFRTGLHTTAMKARNQEVRRNARRLSVLLGELKAERAIIRATRRQQRDNNNLSDSRYLLNTPASHGSVDREPQGDLFGVIQGDISMRTSVTHPLEIAEIIAGPGMGKVGLTFCPGKQQTNAITGRWDRDLRLDMQVIEKWGAAALVTLIEEHEMESLGVPRLGNAVSDEHMTWHYLPVRDVGVPDAKFHETWEQSGAELRAMLRDGFNVLVHCKGGLGRAGMISAQLLIELGWEPGKAVAAVRAVRPGAIETAAQLDYVLGLSEVPEPRPGLAYATSCEDRALGAMLGLAIGDALGTAFEFEVRDTNPRLEDMTGGGPFKLEPGQWTDDTAMALALMDSLLAHPQLDETDLMTRFVSWHETGEYSCTGRCFDIGVTTRTALARFKETGDPFAGSTNPRSAGNGSLMRLAPVAIRHWNDAATLRDVAARQSHTTHGAPEAVDACIAYAEMLADAIAGAPRSAILAPYSYPYAGKIGEIVSGSWRGKRRAEISSTGYVAHSLEAALWCIGRTGSFIDAVLMAANLAGDADTIAAITGQLAGAIYGASGICETWKEQLAWGGEIEAKTLTLFGASLG
jgi:ADP-ribosyl-[dinitrogen reductase] hydrolase